MRHPMTLLCAGLACLAGVVALVACGKYSAPQAAGTTAERTSTPTTAHDAAPRPLPQAGRSAVQAKTQRTAPTKAAAPTRGIQRARGQTPRAAPQPIAKPVVPQPKPVRFVPLPSVAPQLLLGFQDDVGFRWDTGRQALVDRATDAGASVIRTTANWSEIAATQPANARDAFDPAYRFDDLDELARNAQRRGLQLLVTIWGTPAWENRSAGSNHAPSRPSD